ncbi:HAD-IC family P-type ATPase [Nitrogeniibacter mangrovi]|uniref:HAD-IC family P-type ATPase n=1 Tax=Nitrogeniibacter mangrovi TaxID=2016596 RepID=A0A6C1B1U9_9RHOO|nr:HAD-IC family P-type ATPase [Nitrogeniibacter mangrovi]QID17537.1 HAD-IC family P-type ATPase [Nitrogeniibacter mangrovi]
MSDARGRTGQDRIGAPPFACPAAGVAERLGTSAETGLSTAEVAARRARYGPNRLRRQKPRSAIAILAHQFKSIIVWLLAVAAGSAFAQGDLVDGAAIVVVLLINGAIGFFTELHAARSMEALFSFAELRTRVRRDGAVKMIEARELVPGDVVILEAGDVVTADLRLLAASNLQCDESVLTGESMAVGKDVAAVAADTVLGDRSCMVFKGTAVTQGAGEAIVVATGMASEIGRISGLVQAAQAEASPMERRLERLGYRLIWLTLALAVVVIALGTLRGHGLADMIQTGVALAVAAVPEGLPVVATLCLARGMWRMARRNALVNRLSSVETLGATTLILTDKTGTLTENRMRVARYLLADRDLRVAADTPLQPGADAALGWALRIGALCNNADLGAEAVAGTGDPMELALLQVARDAGLDRAVLRGEHPEVAEHAFDPARRMMVTVHARDEGYLYAAKGAPEETLAHCTQVWGADGPAPLPAAQRAQWLQRAHAAASDGLRSLALAMKRSARADDDPYDGLTLVALVCLADPLRPNVPATIAACRDAGIRVVMMSGDHAGTAVRIAREAGLCDEAPVVVEGRELVDFDPATAPPEMLARVRAAEVFARVAPETKLAVVSVFQGDGQIVAMTGDGVNDAPALRQADIGVAMGARGTQVAREAAHMVLKDDDLATIVEAVRQGRVIFDDIRKFVVYLMSCNLSEVLVVGLAVGGGLPVPLLPLQILYLNLVTDVFPAFALGLGEGAPGVMRRPPRDPAEPIVGAAQWRRIVLLGG